jgi:hypothetical protein
MINSVLTCIAELVAHFGVDFVVWDGLLTHLSLLSLDVVVAELVEHLE